MDKNMKSAIIEFLKFLVCGFVAMGVEFGLYYILLNCLEINYNISYTAGFVAGVVCAYFLTTYVTFSSSSSVSNGVAYIAVQGFIWLLRLGLINLLVKVFGLSENISNPLTYIVAGPTNFIILRIVYRWLDSRKGRFF